MADATDETAPIIAVTMGDPAGIGPEIILKALKLREIPSGDARCVVVCSAEAVRFHARVLDLPDEAVPAVFDRIEHFKASGLATALLDVADVPPAGFHLGRASAFGGKAAVDCIAAAGRMALAGDVAAMVTAPVSKVSLKMAGVPHTGHTELLAAMTGVDDVVMMLVGGGLHVAVATRHLPLRDVPGSVCRALVETAVRTVAEYMGRFFDIPSARIAVTGLNPHAGDEGRLGSEEADIIAPAVEQLRREGLACVGPVPGDVAFWEALHGRYDAVVAMYHDQGLGPLKTIAFDSAVNVTLGLPIIRTSVDHGTAFDIAGKGRARTGSLAAAFRAAGRIWRCARKHTER